MSTTPIYACDQCGEAIGEKDKLKLTLLEHGFGHEHHFCDWSCLAYWSEGYKEEKKVKK